MDSKRDDIMRIIIAIAERTLPSTKEIGSKYREQRDKMYKRKTHITTQPEQEESKVTHDGQGDAEMEDQGPRDASAPQDEGSELASRQFGSSEESKLQEKPVDKPHRHRE